MCLQHWDVIAVRDQMCYFELPCLALNTANMLKILLQKEQVNIMLGRNLVAHEI